MGKGYTIGCPGIAGWEYGLMLLGFVALIFLVTLAYQWVFEQYEFRRKIRQARDAADA